MAECNTNKNFPMSGRMRDQQQQTASLQPHQAELLTLADIAGVRVKPEVMKILIELLSMNVQPTELYHMLRDIIVRSYKANRSRHTARRSTTRSLATPTASAPSGPSP